MVDLELTPREHRKMYERIAFIFLVGVVIAVHYFILGLAFIFGLIREMMNVPPM